MGSTTTTDNSYVKDAVILIGGVEYKVTDVAINDSKELQNLTGNFVKDQIIYINGDEISLSAKEGFEAYKVTTVEKTTDFVAAGSTISEDMYNQLSAEEKALYHKISEEVTYRYVSIVLYDENGEPIKVQAEQAVNEGTKVGLSDVGAFNIIALEDFVNSQDITGSIYVGGNFSGTGFVKNGAANGADSYVESFINNSTSTAQIWNTEDGRVTQNGKASDYYITDEDAENTSQYWQAYYKMLLEALKQADYHLRTTDDNGNITGEFVYVQADGNGVANIAGKTTSDQYDNDAQKLYVVSTDTKYVNVNGIKGVVIAPNADVYLSNTGANGLWEGQSSGTVVGRNVYNDGSFIKSNVSYDWWDWFYTNPHYNGTSEGKGSALELHTTKADFDIEGEEIVKTSAIYSTEGREAEYKVEVENYKISGERDIVKYVVTGEKQLSIIHISETTRL